jgi:hypothetical protein
MMRGANHRPDTLMSTVRERMVAAAIACTAL